MRIFLVILALILPMLLVVSGIASIIATKHIYNQPGVQITDLE